MHDVTAIDAQLERATRLASYMRQTIVEFEALPPRSQARLWPAVFESTERAQATLVGIWLSLPAEVRGEIEKINSSYKFN